MSRNFGLYGSDILYPDRSTSQPFSYFVTVPPSGLAVDLDTVKDQLNITNSDDDALLTLYIQSATAYAERFTRRDFLVRTYETFRDYFDYSNQYYAPEMNYRADNFILTKSMVNDVVSIEYLKGGVFTTVDTNIYYVTRDIDFSRIILRNNQCYPQDQDKQLQAIKITFTAGFDPVPEDIQLAIMQIVADMYANRGDCNCDCSGSGVGSYVSGAARGILLQYRIERL